MEITTNTRKNYLRHHHDLPSFSSQSHQKSGSASNPVNHEVFGFLLSCHFHILSVWISGLRQWQIWWMKRNYEPNHCVINWSKNSKFYLKLKNLKCNKFPAGKQCLLWKLFGLCCIPLFCLSSHPPLFHLSALLLSQKIFNLWRFVFRLPDIPKHCATSKNWQPQLISCPQIPQKSVGFFCFVFFVATIQYSML